MVMTRELWICWMLLSFCLTLYGQDTVVVLQPYQIVASPIYDHKNIRIDPNENNEQLDHLIAQNGIGFVKNYGVGQISSLTVKGTGARHSKVYWEGIPLNSPMLGEADLSLLPVFVFSEIDFIDQGLALGEGAFGTSINLNAGVQQEDQLRVRQRLSSLLNSRTELTFSKSFKKFASSTHVFNDFGKNRFAYQDEVTAGRPKTTSEHTDYQQSGIVQQLRWQMTADQTLRLNAWYQYSDRDFEFPKGSQKDAYLRTMVSYKKNWKNNGTTNVKAAWLKERFNYLETIKSHATKVFLTASHHLQFKSHSYVKLAANWEQDHAVAQGFQQGVAQSKGSFYLKYSRSFQSNLNVSASIRELLIDGKPSPLLYGMDLRYNENNDLFMAKASLLRDYNFPTINSRFWSPGGNPMLKPEDSYNADLILKSSFKKAKRWGYTAELNGFYKYINDWIQWTPSDTATFWAAKNIRTVNSLGATLNATSDFYIGDHRIGITGVYTYVSSKVVASDEAFDKAIGHQLIYTPKFQYSGAFSWTKGKWTARYWQEYNHIRYTTEDNEVSLPGYAVGNLSLSYQAKLKRTNLVLQLDVNNLWNTDYRIVSGRPMPLRNYQLSVITNLNLRPHDNQPNQ